MEYKYFNQNISATKNKQSLHTSINKIKTDKFFHFYSLLCIFTQATVSRHTQKSDMEKHITFGSEIIQRRQTSDTTLVFWKFNLHRKCKITAHTSVVTSENKNELC